MKKIFLLALTLTFISTAARAENNHVDGSFEAAGHVMTGFGYQHFTKNYNVTAGIPQYNPTDSDGITYAPGVMGKYLGSVPAGYSDHFSFFVDEVELDLMKSFGENIRLRADLDFMRQASSGAGIPAGGFILEQAYATANIPLGNGIEVLLGRFNTPVGFEAADVAENDTISKSIIVQGLRPENTTGVKIYYPFSDLVDLHFYVVNSLFQDSDVKRADAPSLGFRLGFNWGADNQESTVGISGLWGPESRVSNVHYTYGADVDVNWWITESAALGLEALFTHANQLSVVPGVLNSGDFVTVLAGLANFHYLFNEIWDGTIKYVFAKQYKAVTGAGIGATGGYYSDYMGGGIRQTVHQISLAGGYFFAEGAKFKIEGRLDFLRPGASTGINRSYTYGLAVAFAYNF